MLGCSRGYGTGEGPTPDQTAAMRDILRDYLSAQEIYYSQHETYTASVADAGITSEGATIVILEANERGHAAVIRHEDHDAGCAVFVGSASAPETPGGRQAETEGVVTCD